jgi:hypothetical protein
MLRRINMDILGYGDWKSAYLKPSNVPPPISFYTKEEWDRYNRDIEAKQESALRSEYTSYVEHGVRKYYDSLIGGVPSPTAYPTKEEWVAEIGRRQAAREACIQEDIRGILNEH